jgi:hypothetical protein
MRLLIHIARALVACCIKNFYLQGGQRQHKNKQYRRETVEHTLLKYVLTKPKRKRHRGIGNNMTANNGQMWLWLWLCFVVCFTVPPHAPK